MDARVYVLHTHPYTPRVTRASGFEWHKTIVRQVNEHAVIFVNTLRLQLTAQALKFCAFKVIRAIHVLLKILSPRSICKQFAQLPLHPEIVIAYPTMQVSPAIVHAKALQTTIAQQMTSNQLQPCSVLALRLTSKLLHFCLKINYVTKHLRLYLTLVGNGSPKCLLTQAHGMLVLQIILGFNQTAD
jgi:hypothetical protein